MKIIKSISIVLLFGILFQTLLFATPVDLNTATDVAEFQIKVKQKMKDYSLSDVIEFKNEKGITLAYIVNLEPKGFIAISTDTDITAIIAYSFNCNFPMDDDENNILYYMLKKDMELRLEAISKLSYPKMQENNNLWNYYITENLGYFRIRGRDQWPPEGTTSTGGWLETAWDQYSPYNDFCPLDPETGQRCVVGCVATAMAQIVNYHKYIGEASFDDSDEYISASTNPPIYIDADSTTYDFPSFEQLNLYLDSLKYKYNNNYPLDDEDISALNFACGISIEVWYTSYGSGAIMDLVSTALLNKFNYSSALLCYDISTLYTKLAENNMNALPADISIRASEAPGYHVVVCDGYNTDNYYHLNFGWGIYNPGGGVTPTEAWYSLPDGMPFGYDILLGGIVDIQHTYGTIEGNVTLNGGSGNIADVKVKAGSVIVHPNENGDYILRIPPGTYDITASLYGYLTVTIEDVVVEENQVIENIDFNLDVYSGNTIYVDCFGGGDYLTIQEGINAANDGDTILVYEGTYVENINYNGKNIIVGSLFLTTGDTTYISQTIVDGNQSGSVITFNSNEDSNAVLTGITVTNGMANAGGGIFIYNSSPILDNVIISGNYAIDEGGGIWYEFATPSLSNVTICGNTARNGGGISCWFYSSPTLSNTTISGNTAGSLGGGICCWDNSSPILNNVTICGNTADLEGGGIWCEYTNLNLTDVNIRNNTTDSGGGICSCYYTDLNLVNVTITGNTASLGGGIYCDNSNLDFSNSNRCNIFLNDAEQGKDLYANNCSVNVIVDTFTVLPPNEYWAYPIDNFTFDILHSIYTGNNDLYVSPLGSNNNTGLSPDQPFLTISFALSIVYLDSLNIHTIHLANGTYSPSQTGETFPLHCRSYLSFKGVNPDSTILDGEDLSGIFYSENVSNFSIENITIQNGNAVYGGGIFFEGSIAVIINSKICSNSAQRGAGMYLSNSDATLTNCLINDNYTSFLGGAIYLSQTDLNIRNCTVANNSAGSYGGGIFLYNSTSNIVNSIFWADTPQEIFPTSANVIAQYSDIQGSWSGEGNIDEDPLFVAGYPFDYHFVTGSPCIDAGTPDTTGLNLPPWDLDGNQRIWDGDGNSTAIIDMGCYEYGAPPVGVNEESGPQMVFKLYQNYPNPFSSSTTISFNLATKSHEKGQIKIYNIKGQLIKNFELRIPNSEFTGVVWDGKDKNNKPVSSGIYLYRLKIGNKVINTKKCLLLK